MKLAQDHLKSKQPSKETRAFLEKAIRASVMLLTASIPGIIYNTLRSYHTADKRGLDLSAIGIDDMINIFIRPWIHNLLDLCLLDKESADRITIEMSDSIFGPALKEYKKYMENLDKFL